MGGAYTKNRKWEELIQRPARGRSLYKDPQVGGASEQQVGGAYTKSRKWEGLQNRKWEELMPLGWISS